MNDDRIAIIRQIQQMSREERTHRWPEVQHLEHEYNNAIERIYRDTPGEFRDIMDVFPPEICIQILKNSLPVESYAPSLLNLTNVSTRWHRIIIATPVLWARIEISGIDENALAMLHTFAHFSGKTSLTLTIHVPFHLELDAAKLIMASIGSRVLQVIIKIDHDAIKECDPPSDPDIPQGMDLLLQLRQYIPNVVYIDLGCDFASKLRHGRADPEIYAGILSPQLQVIRGLCFCQTGPHISKIPFHRLAEVSTCMPSKVLESSLDQMPKLKILRMTHLNLLQSSDLGFHQPDRLMSNRIIKKFVSKHQRESLPTKLLEVMAPRLLELDIHTSEELADEIRSHLMKATSLTKLSLKLHDKWNSRGSFTFRYEGKPKQSIPSLKHLEISFREYHNPDGHNAIRKDGRQRDLFDIVSGLYQNIEEVTLHYGFNSYLIADAIRHLSSFLHLKRLKLQGPGWFVGFKGEVNVFTLPSLISLDSSASERAGKIRAPQLLALTLPWDEECENDEIMSYPNLRTLKIKGSDNSSRRIDVPTDGMPALTSITLHVPGCDSLQLGLALSLTEITIIGEPDTPIATSLCFTILYQSEECPSLSSIRLFGCAPEWDVLLTMLESRNFMPNISVSRIRKVMLPSVPSWLRNPIASLLRGLYIARPQNKDLSIQGMVERFFDRETPGCRACVKGMRYPCYEPITNTKDKSKIEDLAYSVCSTVYDSPPPYLDPELLEWIYWREREVENWAGAVFTMGPFCWRTATCPEQEGRKPIEITEHDALLSVD